MKKFPKKLLSKLENRKANNALRSLDTESSLIDFSSNDYLGFSKSERIFEASHQYLVNIDAKQNGSTGSRLLSGNHKLHDEVEKMLSGFYESEVALIFNSGYDANIGFFSSVPQRGDIILYDEFIHASIRDGIMMSKAKSYKFKHNNLEDLNEILKRVQHDKTSKRHSELVSGSHNKTEIYIVTESVFSMDGDTPDLKAFAGFCSQNNYHLVVDEAHAVGVFGANGYGLVQELKLQEVMFARIVTFGKALGCHGAAILGSEELKQYLVNFARSFIYTTALPPHSLATVKSSYESLTSSRGIESLNKLRENIKQFKLEVEKLQLNFIESNSAIHCCVISGNDKVKLIAQQLQQNGFDVKPILSPTVPQGEERLRFCLHSFNSTKEITEVLVLLNNFIH